MIKEVGMTFSPLWRLKILFGIPITLKFDKEVIEAGTDEKGACYINVRDPSEVRNG